jgi:hypothetical protein
MNQPSQYAAATGLPFFDEGMAHVQAGCNNGSIALRHIHHVAQTTLFRSGVNIFCEFTRKLREVVRAPTFP